MTPLRRVVDTNVPVTANGAHEDASVDCVAACGRALQQVMDGGHLFVDSVGSIAAEYRNNLAAFRDVRPGNVFLKWFLTNEWNPARVTHVTVSPREGHPQEFLELPAPPDGIHYDPSDRIFLAVSASHGRSIRPFFRRSTASGGVGGRLSRRLRSRFTSFVLKRSHKSTLQRWGVDGLSPLPEDASPDVAGRRRTARRQGNLAGGRRRVTASRPRRGGEDRWCQHRDFAGRS